jgi:hypothetical protein
MVREMFFELKTNQIMHKSHIQEIYSFIPVIKMLELVNKNALIIFDVDDVLIMPGYDDDFKHPYRAHLWQELKNRLSTEKIEILQSSVMATIKRNLVEQRIVQMFAYLQSQYIPTMALTAMGTGRFGVIKKMEHIRIKELNDVGISFLPLTPLKGEKLAPELENTNMICSDCKGVPMLKSGIIFTAGVDKGVVLDYMFSKYNYYPKTIVFVDDSINNLESLRKQCIKLKIDFHGFHYVAVSLMSMQVIDEHLEKLRFKILELECSWVSYKELIKNFKSM